MGSTLEAQQSLDQVRTIDSEGNSPDRRMATPSAAWGAYSDARNANMKRDLRFAEMAGLFAGFPPTPPAVKERNGQADSPNINLKQFESKTRTYAANVTAITSKGQGWYEVEAEHDDPVERDRRSKYLTECFNWAIKKWDNTGFANGSQYIYWTGCRDLQYAIYGIGIAFFIDPIDFRWKTIPTRKVLVPEGTNLTLENCPAIFIEDQMSVTELYRRRKQKGWNAKAILRNLYDRVEVMSQTAQRQWTYAQFVNSLIDNDQWLISDLQPIRFVHTFTMEFDGTISHSIFTDNIANPTNPMSKDAANEKDPEYKAAEGFIYDKANVAERWNQVWIPFADNAGLECDYHGVKGFGDMLFDACHNNNLMFNRACEGAILQNTLMFKGGSENDIQKLDQITITNNGIMYPGLELEQVKFQGDVQAAMTMVQVGTNIMDSNARLFPQNDKAQGGEQPTATQINFDRADQAQFTSQQIDMYRAVGLDPLGSEMYRRLAQPASKYPESWGGGKVAAEFRKKCAEFGIPEEDLLKVRNVKANRNGGSGNMGLDVFKADQLLGIATPGEGQLNARKQKAAAIVGWENVPAYVQDTPEAVPEDVQIDNENLLIQGGKTPQAFGFQDQERHLQSHMALAAQLSQVVVQFDQAGVTPQNIDDAMKLSDSLAAAIQHSGQHVALLAEVRGTGKRPSLFEQLIKESTRQLNNLQQISQGFAESIQKAAQQQAAEQPSPEMVETQARIQRDNMLAQAQIERDNMKAQAKLGTDAIKTEAKREIALTNNQITQGIKSDQAQQDLRVKAVEDTMEIQKQAALDQQQIAAQAAKEAISVEATRAKAEEQKKAAKAKPKAPKPKK